MMTLKKYNTAFILFCSKINTLAEQTVRVKGTYYA